MKKTKGGIYIPDYIAPTLAGAAGTTRLTDAFIPDLFATYAT